MLKRLVLLSFLLVIFLLGCKVDIKDEPVKDKKSEEVTIADDENISDSSIKKELIINTDRDIILSDGLEKVNFSFSIKKENSSSIINDPRVELFIDGKPYNKKEFTSTKVGQYLFSAKLVELESDSVLIRVKDKISSIKLEADRSRLLADGKEIVNFKIKGIDYKENEIELDEYDFYMNDKKIEKNIFSTKESGEYIFQVISGKFKSEKVKIEAYNSVKSVELKADKMNIYSNNEDLVNFKIIVKNQNDEEYNNVDVTIMYNEKRYDNDRFKTEKEGKYIFYAKTKDIRSKEIIINADKEFKIGLTNPSPGYYQQDVWLNSKIKVVFTDEVDENTLNEKSVRLSKNGENISTEIAYDNVKKLLTLSPKEILEFETIYEVFFTTDIKDVNGYKLKKDYSWQFTTIKLKTPVMIKVEQGIFDMGDRTGELWENTRPVHKTIVPYNFLIGKYELTFEEYDSYCAANNIKKNIRDNNWGREKSPVINVSWFDAIKYCNWLSKIENIPVAYNTKNGDLLDKEGKVTKDLSKVLGYRLPIEREWEYAARGGQKTKNYKYSGSDDISLVSWYADNSISRTHIVGEKRANELGIYDMSGNVAEWCNDYFVQYPGNKSNEEKELKKYRSIRGGSWFSTAYDTRVAFRDYYYPVVKDNVFGFRVMKINK